jgi:hypothetical protein
MNEREPTADCIHRGAETVETLHFDRQATGEPGFPGSA